MGLFDRTRMIGRQVWLSVREVIKAEDRMTVCYGHLPEAYAFSWLSGSCSPFTCLPAPSDLCMIWLPSDSSDRKQVAGHEVVQGNVRKQATKFNIQHRFCRCIYTLYSTSITLRLYCITHIKKRIDTRSIRETPQYPLPFLQCRR